MMADVQTLLKNILSAIHGKDVRQSIHDAIKQCYYDGRAGGNDLEARDRAAAAEARMDTFTQLKNGSTTGDAELRDIRVGLDGTVYGSAGTAVREQIRDTRVIEVSASEPTRDNTVMWINPTETQSVTIPVEIDGKIVKQQISYTVVRVKNLDGEWEGIPAIKGESVYDVAVRHGYFGSEEEFVEELIGNGWVDACLQLETKKADKTAVYSKEEVNTKLAEKVDKFPVGTIFTTIRTDLGEEWILCDGTLVNEETGGDVYSMLSAAPEKHTFELSSKYVHTNKKIYGRNAIDVSPSGLDIVFADEDPSRRHLGVGYFDMDTNKEVFVPMSEMQLVSGSRTSGYLHGIDWNGEAWVMCLNYNQALYFYTSPDLKSWTQVGVIAESENNPSYTTNYSLCQFFYDGIVYHVTGDLDGYQSGAHMIVGSDFTVLNRTSDFDKYRYQLCGDYLFGFEPYSYDSDEDTFEGGHVTIFEPGGLTSISGYDVYAKQAVWQYDEDTYVFFPYIYEYLSSGVTVYKKSTNSWSVVSIRADSIPAGSNVACTQPYYDPENNRLVFLHGYRIAEPSYYVYLPYGADPTVADNYTYEEIPSTDTNLLKLEKGIYPNDVKGWYAVELGSVNDKLHVCNSEFRALPTIANAYIKYKERGTTID